MKLSQNFEYAVISLNYLNLNKGRRVFVTEIAEKFGLSESFLAKILQKLAKAKILNSYRGKCGGFEINSSNKMISLNDIMKITDGGLQIVSCMGHNKCKRMSNCCMKSSFHIIQEEIEKIFQNININDLN